MAATAISPIRVQAETKAAEAMAKQLGVRWEQTATGELAMDEFTANSPERCYFCKRELFSRLQELGRKLGISQVIDGSNYDDLKDHRPGSRAAKELGSEAPPGGGPHQGGNPGSLPGDEPAHLGQAPPWPALPPGFPTAAPLPWLS